MMEMKASRLNEGRGALSSSPQITSYTLSNNNDNTYTEYGVVEVHGVHTYIHTYTQLYQLLQALIAYVADVSFRMKCSLAVALGIVLCKCRQLQF